MTPDSMLLETAEAPPAPAAPERERRGLLYFWRHGLSAVVFVLALVIMWPAQFGGITGLTVVSGRSMEPTYNTGDLVISARQPGYQVGDIVSYMVPEGQPGAGGRVIHRIFTVDSSGEKTVYNSKGDNNASIDPWQFATEDVMGRSLFVLPAIGTVLGGVANPVVLGLASGLLVTMSLWRIGSAPRPGKHRRVPQRTRTDDGQDGQ